MDLAEKKQTEGAPPAPHTRFPALGGYRGWRVRKNRKAHHVPLEHPMEHSIIEPPDFLTTVEQTARFSAIAEHLNERGDLTELDADAVGRYVIAYEVYCSTKNEARHVLKDRDGDERQKASVQQRLSKATKDVRDCAADLGMTITSRGKLNMPAKKTGSAFDGLNL